MSIRHQQLFAQYVTELSAAKVAVDRWWEVLLRSECAIDDDRKAAKKRISQRWPYGPASHPRIIAVVRRYFLACERMNQELEAVDRLDEVVYAHVLLGHWLADDETEYLADFISDL